MRDEQLILTLLAATQLGATVGDHGLFKAHLLWVAAYDHRPALARISLQFARLLLQHGHGIAVAKAAPVLEYAGQEDAGAGLKVAWGR